MDNSRLKRLLAEQYNFLNKSCNEFDKGDQSEAKRIAVTLRVLSHNTSRSVSLISQLEKKNEINAKILSRNHGFTAGLKFYVGATVRFHNGTATYEPMMDLSHPGLREMAVGDWWQQGVLLIDGIPFTRRDVMLSLADKEGGAHVDPKQDKYFRRLTEGNLLRLKNEKGESVKGIELIMARENGFYMMKCIEDNFDQLISSH